MCLTVAVLGAVMLGFGSGVVMVAKIGSNGFDFQ